MKVLQTLYRVLNFLSLDVVAGAVGCSLFFSNIFNAPPATNGIVVLGLTVWIIYTADHLLDVSRFTNAPVTGRHLFHLEHYHLLFVTLTVVSVLDIVLIITLPETFIKRGIVGAVAVVAYLLFQQRLRTFKELIGAILYCSGILIPLSFGELNASQLWNLAQFFTVVFMNLVLFSWFDLGPDKAQHTNSIATLLGLRLAGYIIVALGVLNFVIFLLAAFSVPGLLLLTMGLIHLVLFFFSEFFIQRERFRVVADASFLLPFLYIL